MNKTKVKTAALPAAGLPFRFWLAAASIILPDDVTAMLDPLAGAVQGAAV